MNKHSKSMLLLSTDLSCLCIATVMAYLFRFDFDLLHKINLAHGINAFLLSAVVYTAMFFLFKMQRVIWRYASISVMFKLGLSVASGLVLAMSCLSVFAGPHYIPLSILPLQAFFYLFALTATRCVYRLYHNAGSDASSDRQRVLIIGAGRAAEGLIRDIRHKKSSGYLVVGLLDDDPSLLGRTMHGIKVLGTCDRLPDMVEQFSVEMVMLAIPSLSDMSLINTVYNQCATADIPVRVLPGLDKLAHGQVSIDALRAVSIEDLLGRLPVTLLNQSLIDRWHDKVIMVTGGGGSIGSELCRQIAVNRPRALCVVDHCEYNLFEICRQLSQSFPALQLHTQLVDVSNQAEFRHCMARIKPHIIFHAAAFKHVPMLEDQVFSAVKNNVLATRYLADIAEEFLVEEVVMISTDKAVNPTNVMGMSKRLAEIYCQNKNSRSQTNFITVRFGNVLGSTGSVLPLFRQQLAQGGPLTVTHPDMTRYFMMIPEAAMLILRSSMIGQGGEIFVLDMGKPVKIVDLAEQLITLSGKVPYQQIDIQFTGMRPGEKLFEELFYGSEHTRQTTDQQIFESLSRQYGWEEVLAVFAKLEQAYQQRLAAPMLAAMIDLVPEYQGPHKKDADTSYAPELCSKLEASRTAQPA